MSVRLYLRQVLGLLDKQEKRSLLIWTTVLSATSALDLVGVLLIGTTFYVATNRNSYSNSEFIANIERQFPFFFNTSPDTFIFILLVMSLSIFLLKSFLSPFLYKLFFKNLNQITNRITSQFTSAVLEAKPFRIERFSKQEIGFVLGDGVNNTFSQGIGALAVVISEVVLLLSLLGLLTVMNPILTLSSFVYFAVILVGLNKFMERRQYSATRARIIDTNARNHSIFQSLTSLREIQLSGTAEYYRNEFTDLRAKENFNIAVLQYLNLFPKYFMEFCMVLGVFFLGVYVFLFPSKDAFILLGIFSSSSTRILPSILRIQFSWSVFQSGLVNAETTLSFYSDLVKSSRSDYVENISTGICRDSFLIEFRDIDFAYETSNNFCIKGLNLSILEYESIAIVGKSGSGKTTLIEMLVGNLNPDSGQMLIGNRSADTFVASNPGVIAYVPQQVPILNKSISENIALGLSADAIDGNRIESLLKKVGLWEYIESLPSGVATIVGDSGSGLSGGQRQRIGIARALFYSPKILIFDEATSSLDAESESLIKDLLEDKSLKCTKIVIAHRLSSIKDFERIVYLENGRIVYEGSFNDLRRNVLEFDEQARLLGL
ncbi:ABC transporter ATP-binding protein [bacterium]|nr:ABC transporter ATP-binding protein [bacterium]